MKTLYTFLTCFCLSLFALPFVSNGQAGCSNQLTAFINGVQQGQKIPQGQSGVADITYCPTTNSNSSIQLSGASSTSAAVYKWEIVTGTTVTPVTSGTVSGGTAFLTVYPSTSTVYRLTSTGCSKITYVDFTINPILTLTSSAGSSTVCPGTAVTLNASGGNGTYVLKANGATIDSNTSGVFTVTPQASTTYTVETTSATCTGTVSQKITVATTSNLSLNSNDADNNVSPGGSVILTAGGGTSGSYTWKAYNGFTTTTIPSSGAQITVNPLRTTQYTVTGPTTPANCPGTASIIITVNGVILPVEFASFSASWNSKAPLLTWATASEKSSESFVVERSLDGISFVAIGQRAGAGSTMSRTEYSFVDAGLPSFATGTVYYRLRQVNTDGTFAYSSVAALQVRTSKASFKASAFPNPFDKNVAVEVESIGAGPIVFTVYDVLGKKLLTRTVTTSGMGLQKVGLPEAATLRGGVYYLTIRQGAQQQVLKLSRK
ncbi:T9SS type A sorting domain-containing protein [Hymenobacter sp. BT730]|uniref:T9SS type A sorting domain-containing protein n=1 Tax=Hymenobacter sp. BT730 TaxID=3063332 RepID=UPI0026DF528A|nr:T9SS type A sorting domain-containing protein [Hymenobacter sp. BT730]